MLGNLIYLHQRLGKFVYGMLSFQKIRVEIMNGTLSSSIGWTKIDNEIEPQIWSDIAISRSSRLKYKNFVEGRLKVQLGCGRTVMLGQTSEQWAKSKSIFAVWTVHVLILVLDRLIDNMLQDANATGSLKCVNVPRDA